MDDSVQKDGTDQQLSEKLLKDDEDEEQPSKEAPSEERPSKEILSQSVDNIQVDKDDSERIVNLGDLQSKANQSMLVGEKQRDHGLDDSDSEDDMEETETKSESSSDSGSGSSTHSAGSDSSAYSVHIQDRNPWMRFWLTEVLMLQKIYISFKRNKLPIIIVLIFPLFLAISMKYLCNQTTIMSEYGNRYKGEVHEPIPVQKCWGRNCISIGYSIIGDADPKVQVQKYTWIDNIMRSVADKNKLQFESDVKKISVGNIDSFFNYLKNNPNQTQYSVVWCTDKWTISEELDISLPCQFENKHGTNNELIFYSLWFNKSLQSVPLFKPPGWPVPKNPELIFLQESIDNSIIQYLHEREIDMDSDSSRIGLLPPHIKTTYSDFPAPQDRMFKNVGFESLTGAYFFQLGPLLTFIVILQELAKEKEKKLRQGLNVVGVSHAAYWLSWMISMTALNLCQLVIQYILGVLFGFEFWNNVPFPIMFRIFFAYSMCVISFAFLTSTLITKQDQANRISFSVILTAVLIGVMFSEPRMTLGIFRNERTANVPFIKYVNFCFEMIPTFAFSLAIGLTSGKATNHLPFATNVWTPGRQYTWDDYYAKQTIVIKLTNEKIHAPPVAYYVYCLWRTFACAVILFWYLDHVVSSNRGVAHSLFFPFQRSYWESVFNHESVKKSISDKRAAEREKSGQDGQANKSKLKRLVKIEDIDLDLIKRREQVKKSVETEEEKVNEDEQAGVFSGGLRIIGIQKIYRRYPFGIKSVKDVHAVRGIYLDVPKSELLCLLGHNGAGKSTLFNMLTGIIGPSNGYAKIGGHDIRTQQNSIRKIMGVVPQFDILWDQMTAIEHMRMFSKIKGVVGEEIEEKSDQLLTQVSLDDVRDVQVGLFSGGMKRRLSVAISAIGNPKIIFFDEPTTGMDPVSRKAVWGLMQELKKDKTIILTTHAMEEADALADRIAVVVDGQLKCIGTPLSLKSAYGDGIRVSLVCKVGNEQKVLKLFKKISPSSNLVDSSGGSMIFAVPIDSPMEIAPLFKLVELSSGVDMSEDNMTYNEVTDEYESKMTDISELKTMLIDCGISDSTLEEVFMKVTGKKKTKFIKRRESVDKVATQPSLTEENLKQLSPDNDKD